MSRLVYLLILKQTLWASQHKGMACDGGQTKHNIESSTLSPLLTCDPTIVGIEK